MCHENLDNICQWREERKVSKQLSINYKRVMYLLEPSEAAKRTQGKRVQVYEDEAGNIEIRDGAVVLSAKRFERVPGALNGAVVENKLLSGALLYIQNEQRKRDALLAAKGRLTKRDKRLLAERRAYQAQQLSPQAAE